MAGLYVQLWILACALQLSSTDGRLLTLYGRDFGFRILEPRGWVLDTRAAPQLAHFIFHPAGVDWRQADVVIYVHFVPSEPAGTTAAYLGSSRSEFLEECPFGEASDPGLKLPKGFEQQRFDCPGVRRELIIAQKGDRFLLMLVLGGQNAESVESERQSLERIAASFEWIQLPPPHLPPGPGPRPPPQ